MIESCFVVVSGIPGSGKTSLARALSPAIQLRVVDKDDFLEALFSARGTGDAQWRRALSRESDDLFKRDVLSSSGAIASSFWHQAGMPTDSGTPTEWLRDLPGSVIHLRCTCPTHVAAQRFLQRTRHSGHLDHDRDPSAILTELEWLSQLPPINIEPRIDVDTTSVPDVNQLVHDIRLLCQSHRDSPPTS
jgi:hypothetical protein